MAKGKGQECSSIRQRICLAFDWVMGYLVQLLERASGIGLTPPPSRLGFLSFLFSLCLFSFALSVAFWAANMCTVAIICTTLGFVFLLAFVCFAVHFARRQNLEPLATRADINRMDNHLSGHLEGIKATLKSINATLEKISNRGFDDGRPKETPKKAAQSKRKRKVEKRKVHDVKG